MIACVQLRHFATTVERKLDGALADVPIILVEYPKQRGRVLAASLEAECAGVKRGMALSRARALMPRGAFLTATPTHIEQALDHLLAVFWTFTGQVEIDDASFPQSLTAYLDLGNLNETAMRQLSAQLMDAVRALFPGKISVGLARGKFPAFIAASSGQAGEVQYIQPGSEAAFVAPYPVTLLPLSKASARKLRLLCIHRIGELAVFSRAALVGQFGRPGRLLHALAQGMDSRSVVPRRVPQMEQVRRSFDYPLKEPTRVEFVLEQLTETLVGRLEKRVAAAHQLTLTLHLDKGGAATERLHVLQAVATARGIAQALHPLLERMLPRAQREGIYGIEIVLMQFVSGAPQQMDLLTHRPARQLLIDLTPALIQRYGARFYEPVLDEPDLLPERRFHLQRIVSSQ